MAPDPLHVVLAGHSSGPCPSAAPKHCALAFTGPHHYLGGRFLPPQLAARYRLQGLPRYPGTAMCVRMPPPFLDDAYVGYSGAPPVFLGAVLDDAD